MSIDSFKQSSIVRDCEPLLTAAGRDLFRKNAFRITGLLIEASPRDIAKRADTMNMLAELGQDPHTQSAALPIQPPPSPEDLREAFQKLKDPEQRIVNEFFWFWPETLGQKDPALQKIDEGDSRGAIDIWASREKCSSEDFAASHNLAIYYHACATDWDNYAITQGVPESQRQTIAGYWQEAFKRWERLASNDRYWELVVKRIRALNDPRLTTGFARRMRRSLPEAIDRINAELAFAYAEAGQMPEAERHVRYMRETHQGLDNVDKTAELVLAPVRTRLAEHLQSTTERVAANPEQAPEATADLLKHAKKILALCDLFFGREHDECCGLADEIAERCNTLLVQYHKTTNDNQTALDLLRNILHLASSIELRQQIEKNIGVLTGNLAFEGLAPIYAKLKAIQDAAEHPRERLAEMRDQVFPMVSEATQGLPVDAKENLRDAVAVVLRGISIEAWNKHRDQKTAVSAIKYASEYATGSELKARVDADLATLQKLRQDTKAESSAGAKGCLGLIVGVVLLVAMIGSCNSNSTTSSSTSSSRPSSYQPAPVARPTVASPPTYRVPSSSYQTFETEKREIERQKASLRVTADEVERLRNQIDAERIYLNRTSDYAVNAFNAKVRRYNSLLESFQQQEAALEGRIDAYNNALIRSSK